MLSKRFRWPSPPQPLRWLSRWCFKCSAYRRTRNGDNVCLLAGFFVGFLLLVITTQVMVIRNEWTDGKSHPNRLSRASASSSSSSSSSSSGQRPLLRFGRAPFGRVLQQQQQQQLSQKSDDSNHSVKPGEWIKNLPQRQSRDQWVEIFWPCYQHTQLDPSANGSRFCPWQRKHIDMYPLKPLKDNEKYCRVI